MPEKAATLNPLKSLWYARCAALSTNPVYHFGPFDTPDDALRQIADDHDLPAGAIVEMGILSPWVPDASATSILASIAIEARGPLGGGETGRPWSETLESIAERNGGEATRELNDALNLVLMGWLTRHEAHPNFGHLHDVIAFEWDGQRFHAQPLTWRPDPEWPSGPAMPPPPRPGQRPPIQDAVDRIYIAAGEPPKWERCNHTGENVTREPAVRTRCTLKLGHAGPHAMEPWPAGTDDGAPLGEPPGEPGPAGEPWPEPPAGDPCTGRIFVQPYSAPFACTLPSGHDGPHHFDLPVHQLRDGRCMCRHVREDGKRCNIFALPDDDHQQHKYTCYALIGTGDHADRCDLDEGHAGPHQAIPF